MVRPPPTAATGALLDANPSLKVLVFRRETNSGNGKFTVVSYTQQIDALPVHNSLVTIPVFLGSPNRISYIGIPLVHPPEPSLPAGSIDETAAKAKVTLQYGFTSLSTAVEVIHEADSDEIHRAWRFRGWDDDEAYLFFVDTTSGEIVGAVDQVFESVIAVPNTGVLLFLWNEQVAPDDPVPYYALSFDGLAVSRVCPPNPFHTRSQTPDRFNGPNEAIAREVS